ncbi:hypothetical protein QJS10_CPA09g01547 [Acorus calamus]|uniref:Reverse transcriptase zinc-binding domain-containing protein n=1 Tax=Acorus calamus TaxID=4465 RepID=A0AAV9E903_ACOCL|nr:hypothetical protein QJS10_CPA09g01547 [Acorus calamus]
MPRKIKIFVWLTLQNRLLTKIYRAKWRPAESTDCAMCQAEPESVKHLLLRCPATVRLWGELSRATGASLNYSSLTEFRDAMSNPAPLSAHALPNRFTRLLLPPGLWTIWRGRNGALFRGQRVYFENIWDTTLHLLQDWGRHLAGLSRVYYLEGEL